MAPPFTALQDENCNAEKETRVVSERRLAYITPPQLPLPVQLQVSNDAPLRLRDAAEDVNSITDPFPEFRVITEKVDEVMVSIPFDFRSISGDSVSVIVVNFTVSSLSVPTVTESNDPLNEEIPLPLNSMFWMVRVTEVSVLVLRRGVLDALSVFDVVYSPELSASPETVSVLLIVIEVFSAACLPVTRLTEVSVVAEFTAVTPLFIVRHGRSDHPHVEMSSDPVADAYTPLPLPLLTLYIRCRREKTCVPTCPE